MNLILFVFVVGLVLGSFLNVVIDRLPSGKFFSNKRSYCLSCKKTLKWYDLVPLFSYLLLKGKCRYCRKPIPYRLPFVELVTGIGFVAIFLFTPPLYYAILPFLFIIFSLFIAIFFIDAKHSIIPDILLLFLAITVFVMHIYMQQSIIPYLLVGSLSALFFFLLFVGTKGKGMGFGDVKFAFVIGLLLGFPDTIVAFYGAFVTGAVVSILLILLKKKKLKGSTIPFGPFMIIGVGIAVVLSDFLISYFF